MNQLLFLNLLMGVALAYAARREYPRRQHAPTFRVLASTAGVSLVASLALLLHGLRHGG